MNFIDRCNCLTEQYIKHAVILDEGCKHVGTITIRYTDDVIGLKHESGVILPDLNMDYDTTVKGDAFTPFNLHELFSPKEVDCYDSQGRIIDNESAKTYGTNIQLAVLKHNDTTFKVVWA